MIVAPWETENGGKLNKGFPKYSPVVVFLFHRCFLI